MKKKLSVLLTTLLMISLSPQYIYAEDTTMEEWLNEEFNPVITDIVKEYNDVLEENWYVNLSYYLIKDEKVSALERLKSLRKELKKLTKETKIISIPKAATKKEKRLIKDSKKQLIKALNRTDKDAKRIIKRIKKEKSLEVISERKYEKSRIAKVDEQYSKLNDKYDIRTKKIKLTNFIKINDNIAKNFINKEEKKREKEEQRKRDAAKKAEDAKLVAEAEKKAIKKAEEDARKAEELEKIERQKAEEEQAKVKQQEEKKKETIAAPNESEWFQNCTELRKKYPSGVASDHPAYQSKMDRDNDGWACE